MEKILNDYLEEVEKYLRPLPVFERVDIVKEIKSEILELQSDGKTTEEILGRLDNPKELAKAYLGDLIAKSNSFSWNRILAICAYYSLVSISGLFLIPVLGVCSLTFIFCGILCPIMGAVKLIDGLFHLDIPFADNIVCAGVENIFIVFLLCIFTGVALSIIGYGCWKLLVIYIKSVSKAKQYFHSSGDRAKETDR